MQLTTNAIILRHHRIQEDRRLVLLTEHYGVIEAWANGANKTRSRLAASTEPLCYGEITLFFYRGRYTVDKADPIRMFFGLRSNLDNLALASYFAELTAELAPHSEPAEPYLRLLLNTLHLLEEDKRPPLQLKALYELRLLTLSGYMPDLVACRGCASYEAAGMFFFPATGDLCCPNCFDGQAGGICVSSGVLAAMRHIVYSEPDKLFRFALSEAGLALLAHITEDYLKFQLERSFPSLEFYHSIRG